MPMRDEHGDQQSEQMIDAFGMLKILRIYKWMLLGLTIIGTGLGILVGLGMTPKYTAVAEILVTSVRDTVSGLGGDAQQSADETALKTEVRKLTSRSHVERVMRDAGLYDPIKSPWQEAEAEEAASADSWFFVKKAFALFSNEGDQPKEMETNREADDNPLEKQIEEFYENYSVLLSGDSYVIAISYTSDDPREAARVANQSAENYIDGKRLSREAATTETSGWLDKRVQVLREHLTKAENEIARFRAEHNLQNSDLDAKAEELSGFSAELIRLRADLSGRQARLTALTKLRASGQPVYNLPEISNAQTVGDLRLQQRELQQREAELADTFGPRHPEMLALRNEQNRIDIRLDLEVDRIIQNLKDDVEAMRGQQAAFEAEIASIRQQNSGQSEVEVQLREREREAEATRELYQTFLQRSKRINEEKTIVQSGISLISEAAAPAVSSTPTPKLTGLIGFCLAFVSGMMIAVLRDHRDQRIRSEPQVNSYLGLHLATMVPQLKRLKRKQRPHHYLLEKPMSVYTDAFRKVLLDLRPKMENGKNKVLVTTSTLPNEGKTTFSLSLATLSARSGTRTLLLDLDLRHPSILQELGIKGHVNSIVDYVQGDLTFEETIWKHPVVKNLHVAMPMAAYSPDPTEILDSKEMKTFLEKARAHYDIIIIDSAPLFAVSEARIVASLGDLAIFILRWGETDRETAQGGLQRLKESGIEIYGAAMSQVDFKKHRTYQFRDAGHHYQEYENYYVN